MFYRGVLIVHFNSAVCLLLMYEYGVDSSVVEPHFLSPPPSMGGLVAFVHSSNGVIFSVKNTEHFPGLYIGDSISQII